MMTSEIILDGVPASDDRYTLPVRFDDRPEFSAPPPEDISDYGCVDVDPTPMPGEPHVPGLYGLDRLQMRDPKTRASVVIFSSQAEANAGARYFPSHACLAIEGDPTRVDFTPLRGMSVIFVPPGGCGDYSPLVLRVCRALENVHAKVKYVWRASGSSLVDDELHGVDAAGVQQLFVKYKGNIETYRIITVEEGRLHDAATHGEIAVIAGGAEVYRRGPDLVRPVVEDVDAADGKKTKVAQLSVVSQPYLRDVLCRAARWEKFDARSRGNKVIDAPLEVAQTILHRYGEWIFEPIVGVISTPTMRPDGSLLTAPGYDAATGLLLVDPPPMPRIPAFPTTEDAKAALDVIDRLFDEFEFVDDASRSVALSAAITPVVRGAFPVTPMHVSSAPQAGSGKSYLFDVVAAIAIGRRCPVMAAGRTEEETEKRLGAALIAGQPIISIDNVNGTLDGEFLCQAIERPLIDVRVLGKSESKRIESRSTIFATGNNIKLVGDMPRRVLRCRLDAKMERPELRQFDRNPLDMVLLDRGRFIAAALTICRAYVVAGRPNPALRLASFEAWSDTVRSALIWLGHADPVATQAEARAEDPEHQEMIFVFASLRDAIGTGKRHTAAEIAKMASSKDISYSDQSVMEQGDLTHPELQEALNNVAGWNGGIDSKKLGKWFARHKDRIASGVILKGEGDDHGHAFKWWLETA